MIKLSQRLPPSIDLTYNNFDGEERSDLIGRKVLIVREVMGKTGMEMDEINRIMSDYFEVKKSDTKFRIRDGSHKTTKSKMDWGNHAKAHLITEKEYQLIGSYWYKRKILINGIKRLKNFKWEEHPDLVAQVLSLLPPEK